MRKFISFIVLTLILGPSVQASTQDKLLSEAYAIIESVSSQETDFKSLLALTNGVEIRPEKHAFALMIFNTDSKKIEVFQNALALDPLFLASSLVHEARHLSYDHHTACVKPLRLAGMLVCDDKLPPLDQWREGGSYVYELAFQKRAIDLKLPGHEKYIRQFIGNLHVRFAEAPSIELLDEWLGPELLESQKDFIAFVRKNF